MTKKELLNLMLGIVAEVVPGAKLVKGGVEVLVKMNDNPDDDVDEITGAVTQMAMGVVLGANGLTGKTVVNADVLAVLNDKLNSDVAWYVENVKRLKPVTPVPVPDATGSPV